MPARAGGRPAVGNVAALLAIVIGLVTLVVPAMRKQGWLAPRAALASERDTTAFADAVPAPPTVPEGPRWPRLALTAGRAAPDALPSDLEAAIASRAREEITRGVTYASGYLAVSGYPMGDIPQDRGACTDVVVRSLRGAGIDLQQLVHEDVLAAPDYYRLPQVDANIDHRRISTMHAYLARNAMSLTTDIREKGAFRPGDIVFFSWTRCPNCKLDHVGVVSDRVGPSGRLMVVENGGPRAVEQDSLDRGSLVGHFRALARR
jgi:uncharacterized protein YijF (DUF1287 family)